MTSPTSDRRQGLVGNTPIKAPIALATTGPITLSGEQIIDGVMTSASRVLVKDQANPIQNGIYDSSSASWTRTYDADGAYDVAQGTMAFVTGGVSNANALFSITSAAPVVGSTPIVWRVINSILNLASSIGASLVGFIQLGVGATLRTVMVKLREFVHATDYAGYDSTGATDSYAALIAADTYARSVGKPLYIVGTPRIKTQLNLTSKTHWIFQGGAGVAAGDLPGSYLIKDVSMTTAAVVMSAQGILFEGGGIVCDAGNTGDSLQILGNSCEWLRTPYFYLAGRDNIRIGSDTAGANANGFRVDSPRCQAAGRDNIHIDDASANANAGLILRPLCQAAGNANIYMNRADLGNTIIAPILENAPYNLYFDALANRNVILGGDIETATTANVFFSSKLVQLRNRLIDVTVAGVVTNTDHYTQVWTTAPTIYGATAAGTAAYATQHSVLTYSDGQVCFGVELIWTGFTGTGQTYMDLPDVVGLSPQTAISASIPAFIEVAVTGTFALSAGAQLKAFVSTVTLPPRVQFYTSNAGVLTAFTMPAAGTVYIGGAVSVVTQ